MRCHIRTQGIGETLFVLISDSLEDAVLGRRHMTALLPSDPEQQEGKTTRCCSALNDRFERFSPTGGHLRARLSYSVTP